MGDASEKEEVRDEEADAQVQVDGGASSLYGAAELKRQDAEYEAQQWDGQPDLGHHQEPKGVLVEIAWYLSPFWEIMGYAVLIMYPHPNPSSHCRPKPLPVACTTSTTWLFAS